MDSIFLLVAMYSGCDLVLIGASFTIAVGAMGALAASLLINPMDLSPNYAGTIFGVLGTFSDFMGVIAPNTASYLTPNVSCFKFKYALFHLKHICFHFPFSHCNPNGAMCF